MSGKITNVIKADLPTNMIEYLEGLGDTGNTQIDVQREPTGKNPNYAIHINNLETGETVVVQGVRPDANNLYQE